MNPMKVLAALGEAGAIATDDPDTYERLIELRYNGTQNRETCVRVALNGRLDTVQAAILLVRLKRLDSEIERRREIAARYNIGLRELVTVQEELLNSFDVYYTYTIRVPERDSFIAHLEGQGIQCRVRHPILMSDQPAHCNFPRADLRNSSVAISQIVSLPIHHKLSDSQIDYVIDCIRNYAHQG
jgi:dTDP-4-amino-4,6-dideoxygalactose transaminase